MLENPFQTVIPQSRRRFMKRGLGMGIGALTAGCGTHILTTTPNQSRTSPTDQSSSDPSTGSLQNQQPMPSGAVTPATAIVTQNGVGSFDSTFVGFSFEKGELVSRIFSTTDPNVLTLFKALGPGIIRIGGSSVDDIKWLAAGGGRIGRQMSRVDIDSFATFIKLSGWQVIYGINLAQNTEADAAEEAEYVANALRGNLYCFSLGNEPASYAKTPLPYPVPAGYSNWGYATFWDRWVSLRDAIIQRVPDATFSGPDATGGSVQ